MCGPRESGLKTPTIKTPLCGPRESGLKTRLLETHLTTPQKGRPRSPTLLRGELCISRWKAKTPRTNLLIPFQDEKLVFRTRTRQGQAPAPVLWDPPEYPEKVIRGSRYQRPTPVPVVL